VDGADFSPLCALFDEAQHELLTLLPGLRPIGLGSAFFLGLDNPGVPGRLGLQPAKSPGSPAVPLISLLRGTRGHVMSTDPTQLQQLLSLARTDLACYIVAMWPPFLRAPHHEAIIAKLEAVERGEISRLMIFLPPRHGNNDRRKNF